jgi:hypothetical protein
VLITPGSISFGLVDDTQPIWIGTASFVIHNHGTGEDIFNVTTMTAPPAGVTIELVPPSATVPPGGSVSVNMTLTIDNYVYGYPDGNPPQVVDRINVTSTTTQESYTILYAYMKATSLKLVVDELPWWLIIHDNNKFFRFYSYSISTRPETLQYFLPKGKYDVIGEYWNYQTMILIENINLQGSQYVLYGKPYSKNHVYFQSFDPRGNPVSLMHTTGFLGIIQKISNSGIIIYGEGMLKKQEFDFPDVSENYTVEARQESYGDNNHEYYQFTFGLPAGITSSKILKNDPQQFKEIQYGINVPDGTSTIYVLPALEGNSSRGMFPPAALTAPFGWKAYIAPNPYP